MTTTEPTSTTTDPDDPIGAADEDRVVIEGHVVDAEVIDVDTSGATIDGSDPDPEVEVTVIQPHQQAETGLVPYGAELHGCAEIAATMAVADNVPKALRNKPAAILAVILTGRELGIAPMTALRTLHVIDGQVTMPPKVRLSIVRQLKLGKVWPDPDNDTKTATWYATRNDDPEVVYRSTYTTQDAAAAALMDKDNWKHYPARMLSWRALGYLLDDAFTEVGTGLYSADELGAIVDEDGAPIIDVTGDPLVGATRRPGTDRYGNEPPPEPATDLQRSEISAKIEALGEACPSAVEVLKGEWMSEGLPPLKDLPRAKVAMAKAVVDKITRQAKAGAYDAFEEASGSQEATSSDEAASSEAPGEPEQPSLPESSLPTEHTHTADLQWLAEAPTELVEKQAEVVKAMDLAEVVEALVKADRVTRGNEAKKRQVLCAFLVRRAMAQAASVASNEA